ncbi:hypothetical protein JHK85_045674 [Glycine max]|nr:hypothetical protein JHK86_045103 [Glycine max]KAG4951807.1 hypothetical protein JHK85_045674 [Glycine max]
MPKQQTKRLHHKRTSTSTLNYLQSHTLSTRDLGVEGAQEEEHRRDRPKRKKTLLHLIDKRKRFKGKIMA